MTRRDPIHLLYLIDSLVPGGAERSLAALAPRFIARGIVLDVATLDPGEGLQRELQTAGARVFSVGGGGRLNRIRGTRALIDSRRPDVVHTTLFEADVAGRVAARLVGVPSVTSLVSVPYGPAHRHQPGVHPWKVRGAQLVDAVTARLASRFHALSNHVADLMSARLRIPPHLIDVIPRGLDPELLGAPSPERRAEVRGRLGIDPRRPVVLAAARQDHPKGLDVLVDAFPTVRARVRAAMLLLAGRPGGQTALLTEQVARHGLGDSVRFLGPRTDVPDLLVAADVCVIPSRWEGFGVALIEAMGVGARIVATDLPTTTEITDGGRCARLVPVGHPAALAEAIVQVLDDPRADDRAEAARARFLREYTVDTVADAMIAFYDRALAGPARQG